MDFQKIRNILGGNISILFHFQVKWIHSNKQKDGHKPNTEKMGAEKMGVNIHIFIFLHDKCKILI